MQYTVVQHSAAAYKGDPTFEKGLEPRGVPAREAAKVAKAGGVVFPNYAMADEYAFEQMYPAWVTGLIPDAPGTFAATKIDGMAVYVPKGA